MKKILIMLFAAFALFSCGKNYNCEYTATDSANNDSFLLENYKEDDAKAKCTEFSNTGILDGCSCELK